jgi:hypothetical protein
LICIKKTRRSRFRVLVVPSRDLTHINALAARYWKVGLTFAWWGTDMQRRRTLRFQNVNPAQEIKNAAAA